MWVNSGMKYMILMKWCWWYQSAFKERKKLLLIFFPLGNLKKKKKSLIFTRQTILQTLLFSHSSSSSCSSLPSLKWSPSDLLHGYPTFVSLLYIFYSFMDNILTSLLFLFNSKNSLTYNRQLTMVRRANNKYQLWSVIIRL